MAVPHLLKYNLKKLAVVYSLKVRLKLMTFLYICFLHDFNIFMVKIAEFTRVCTVMKNLEKFGKLKIHFLGP